MTYSFQEEEAPLQSSRSIPLSYGVVDPLPDVSPILDLLENPDPDTYDSDPDPEIDLSERDSPERDTPERDNLNPKDYETGALADAELESSDKEIETPDDEFPRPETFDTVASPVANP